ncbi:hypothetical protein AC629_22785 [Bradyrhizobium sp. NAS80.1]|uniref:hypothetical protein n=1 Tax=Bradyrhizobium sp. NAS80.1 TaxID=1680159 RepID=UPI00096037DE|nr:hypothetical protein [Bradyrhizobium sp. NAS80.1]OKO83372.1 hypothetical protein AC629_22785 [Bradyrhizobium sp. NAS80.1]
MIMKCVGLAFIMAELTCTEVEPPAPAVVCPPVRAWSRAFQQQLAAEIGRSPDSALARVAIEAIGDRDVARACNKARTKR